MTVTWEDTLPQTVGFPHCCLPESKRAILRTTGIQLAIRTEANTVDRAKMAFIGLCRTGTQRRTWVIIEHYVLITLILDYWTNTSNLLLCHTQKKIHYIWNHKLLLSHNNVLKGLTGVKVETSSYLCEIRPTDSMESSQLITSSARNGPWTHLLTLLMKTCMLPLQYHARPLTNPLDRQTLDWNTTMHLIRKLLYPNKPTVTD